MRITFPAVVVCLALLWSANANAYLECKGTTAESLNPDQDGDPRLAVLDTTFYLSKYPELKKALWCNPVRQAKFHWLNHGIAEGRDSSASFSLGGYRARYPDLQGAFGFNYPALLNHWFNYGQKEGRNPKADGTLMVDPRASQLDPIFYGARYADLRNAFGGIKVPQLVEHWLVYGEKECRQPSAAVTAHGPGSDRLDLQCNVLRVNETLISRTQLWFAILQNDGNLCVYPGNGIGMLTADSGNKPHRCISNASYGPGPYYATLQGDGNLCVYRGSDPAHRVGTTALWCSMATRGANPYNAVMQDDGNLAVYIASPWTFVWNLGLPEPVPTPYDWTSFANDVKSFHCLTHPGDIICN